MKEIARVLGVARSSVSRWVRDIELTPAQREALETRNPLYNRQVSGAGILAARARAHRDAFQAEGRARARDGATSHAMGCMLFWAEGEKYRNGVGFSNSDPDMMRFFVDFLRTQFAVRDEEVRVTCYLFADHIERQREVERFWLGKLGLPETCLCKSVVDVYSKYSEKKRRNKLPHGTCKLVVNRTKHRPEHLRLDPGIRRLRPTGVARVS